MTEILFARKDELDAFLAGGVLVTDGDKGDLTISGSGTIWTIDNGVVTLTKMADIATASFLGRNTAGIGSPEVLSIATAKTMLNLAGTNSGDQPPGGSSLTIQYNNAGDFGGMSGTSWDDTNRSLTLTGATITALHPILNLTQTWNNGSIVFTAVKLDVGDTVSDPNSLLLDLRINSSSKFYVTKSGIVSSVDNIITLGAIYTNAGANFSNGNVNLRTAGLNFTLPSDGMVTWSSGSDGSSGADTFIKRGGSAAILQLGAADSATPVAQTLQVQSVITGTMDTSGVNWTFNGSKGTGTGEGGNIIFKVAPAGSTGSSQNPLIEYMRITGGNRLKIGYTSNPSTPFSDAFSSKVGLAATEANEWGFTLFTVGNSAGSSSIVSVKTRGTDPSLNVAVQNNDGVADFPVYANDGTIYRRVGSLVWEVDGSVATNDIPARLLFLTRPSGGTDALERLRIDNAGHIVQGGFSWFGIDSGATQLASFSGEDNETGIELVNYGNHNGFPSIVFAKTKGATPSTQSAIASNAIMGVLDYYASDGTNWIGSAAIITRATGTISTGVVPSQMEFHTTDTSGAAAQRFFISSNGNIVIGTAALATNATDGFLYITGGAGTPTGTPTSYTGRYPLYWDSTNLLLYAYSGGAWQTVDPTGTGGGGGSPGGSGTEVQYRVNASTFGGMSGTTWDDTNRSLDMVGATLTANHPILNLAQTWNNAGVVFTGLKFNVTDTASAAGSLLLNVQKGGIDWFNVDKTAVINAYNSNDGAGNYERGTFGFSSNVLTIGTQNGGTGVARNLQFVTGGTNRLDFGVTNSGSWDARASLYVGTNASGGIGSVNQLILSDAITSGSAGPMLHINGQFDIRAGIGPALSTAMNILWFGQANIGAAWDLTKTLDIELPKGTFRAYNTVDSTITNYERGTFGFASNVLTIGTEKGGTGATRNLQFIVGGTNQLDWGVTAASTWTIPNGILSVVTTNVAGAIRVGPLVSDGLLSFSYSSAIVDPLSFQNTNGGSAWVFGDGAGNPGFGPLGSGIVGLYDINNLHANWTFNTSGLLAIARGTSATAFNAYNTYGATNYERATFDWTTTANVLTIGTQAGGTGVARNINIQPAGGGTTFVSGAQTNVRIGKDTGAVNYNIISLNGSTTDVGNLGFVGGATGDSILYIEVPTGGSFRFVENNSRDLAQITTSSLELPSNNSLSWSSTTFATGSADTFLSRASAATIQLGAADEASPVAQTLRIQSVSNGTSNTNGNDYTVHNSRSTGTGVAGHSIIRTGFKGISSASTATFTVTIASPAVFTITGHGYVPGQVIRLTTTGALPTGLSTGVDYYVISAGLTANAFEVSTSFEGSAVNTSGTQSGTHTSNPQADKQNNGSIIATWGPSGLTGSQAISLLDLAQTWNTTGTVTAIKLNILDLASNAASKLLDLQVGGASKLNVTKAGTIALASAALITWNADVGLARNAADILEVNNGTAGTFRDIRVRNATDDNGNIYSNIPQNSQSTAYTLVLSDANKHILHPSSDATARTFTIPANSSVAYPIGTTLTFVNQNGAGTLTIAINTDTMRLAGAGTTGSRTLTANGVATAVKLTSTEWIISGTNLT